MSDARTRILAGLLLLVFAALTLGSAAKVRRTTDEPHHWLAGRSVTNTGDWVSWETRLHGPVPVVASQLLTRNPSPEDIELIAFSFNPSLLLRARASLLPFGLFCAWLTYVIARRLFGNRGGLLALASFVLHPLMFGYAALIAVDMTHSAFILLAFAAVLSHAESPTWRRRLGVGAALGLAFATKYLALLYAPVIVLFVMWHAVRRHGIEAPSPNRALRALGAMVTIVAVALVTLHACYGFLPGFGSGDVELYSHAGMQAVIGTPIVGHAVRLFPAPMLLGVDYQLNIASSVDGSYLLGRFGAAQPAYHVWGFLTKTPLPLLFAGGLALVVGLPRWLREKAEPKHRDAARFLLAAAALPLFYLSFIAKLQPGIRYVLPLVPLFFIAIGGLAELPLLTGLSSRARATAVGALLLVTSISTVGAWPNGIAYFSPLIGGEENAWRHFIDSNSEWGQLAHLTAEDVGGPGTTVVMPGEGPRFGRIAIYIGTRAPHDPEDLTRAHHWLDPFEPVAHAGTAWLVYEVTAEEWRAAAEDDPRARVELALALLGAGHVDEAEREFARLPAHLADPLGKLVAAVREAIGNRGLGETDRQGSIYDLAGHWLAANRPDLALELVPPGPDLDPRGVRIRVLSMVKLQRVEDALALMELYPDLHEGDLNLVLLMAELYRRAWRPDDGVALLERNLASFTGPERIRLEEEFQRRRADYASWEIFKQSLW